MGHDLIEDDDGYLYEVDTDWLDNYTFASGAEYSEFCAAVEPLQLEGDIKPLVEYLRERRTPLSPGVAHALARILSGEPLPNRKKIVQLLREPVLTTRYFVQVKPKTRKPKRPSTTEKLFRAALDYKHRVANGISPTNAAKGVIKDHGIHSDDLFPAVKQIEAELEDMYGDPDAWFK